MSQPQSPQSALVLEERADAAPTDATVSSRLLLFVCGRGFCTWRVISFGAGRSKQHCS